MPRYHVPDVLTLLAIADRFPGAFVCVEGMQGHFCMRSLSSSRGFDRICALLKIEPHRRLIMTTTWQEVDALIYDQATPKCLGCGKLVSDHGDPDAEPSH